MAKCISLSTAWQAGSVTQLLYAGEGELGAMGHIAMYLGDSLPPNLSRLLSGMTKLADPEFGLTTVGTDIDPQELPAGITHVDIPGVETARGFDRMRAAYRTVDTYLEEDSDRPDAVWQITRPQFHALPVLLATKKHDVRMAGRIPGNKFDEYREQPSLSATIKTYTANNVLLRSLRWATSVVALSEYNRAQLRKRGVPEKKIRVLRPPLDTDTFAPADDDRRSELRSQLGFGPEKWSILFVGRLSELKGMEAFERILTEFADDPRYEFHFVGTGPYHSRFEERDNAVLHGRVDPTEVHRYYKAADLYFHPSLIEEGGISWTMVEAAATGLPVVARDRANAAELTSLTFTHVNEVVEYLETPDDWEPAPYPEQWSLSYLTDEYNDFFASLTR